MNDEVNYFKQVKQYLTELGYVWYDEDAVEEIVVITDESDGIRGLVIDCEDPILIMEQKIMPFNEGVDPVRLMQMTREMVHGSFCLDEEAKVVIWKDTLQLANLDLNEVQGSINALAVAMADFSSELIEMSKGGN